MSAGVIRRAAMSPSAWVVAVRPAWVTPPVTTRCARSARSCGRRSGRRTWPSASGGDEVCLLLASADAEGTRVVAERVIAGSPSMALPKGATLGASFGIATHMDGDTPAAVVDAADQAMYRAKRLAGAHIAFAPSLERVANARNAA